MYVNSKRYGTSLDELDKYSIKLFFLYKIRYMFIDRTMHVLLNIVTCILI